MPTKFNTTGEGRQVDLSPVIPVDAPMYTDNDGQPQGAAGNFGTGVGSIIDQFNSGVGEEVLGAYSVEASEIVGETAGYKKERERILAGLSSARDKAAMESYLSDLQRLKNGEIQGALDPLSARARLNTLVKNYSNRYPRLALDFRKIHNGVMDDVEDVAGVSSTAIDPVEEATNELIKTATSNGWSAAQQMAYNHSEVVSKAQERELAAKSRLGMLSQADISKVVLAKSNVIYTHIANDMGNAVKNPNFQGMNWLFQLGKAKADIEANTNMLLQQAQLDGKFTLEGQYQKDLVAQATAPFDQLIAMAPLLDNPKTRASASESIRKITENTDYANFRKEFGPLVSIVPYENMWDYMKDYTHIAKQLEKGQQATLEQLAKYDPQTRIILDHIYSKGWKQFAVDNAVDVEKKTPRQTSGNPLLDKLNLQAAVDYVLRPTYTDKEAGLKYLASDPNAFEAWDNRKDLVNMTKNFPGAVDALKQNSARLLAEEATQSDMNSTNKIEYNALDPRTPFRIAAPTDPIMQRYGVPNTTNPHTQELVDRLNQQYRVFSNFMSRAEIQKWGGDTIDNLKLVSSGEMDEIVTNTEIVTPSTEPVPEVLPEDTAVAVEFDPLEKADGMLKKGNIDLDNRPTVNNPDGSISTLKSITIEQDGKYILIPTINPTGEQLSDEDAVTLYEYTGEHLGVFKTQQAADDFATKLSFYMGRAK